MSGSMTKRLRICSRLVVALFAVALIVWLLVLAGSSEAPQVTLQFTAITNSVSLGQVARFTLTNHGKHPVQRLPLYVVEFQDREKNVITIAPPPVLGPASDQTIEVPLSQPSASWRLGVSCSLAGIRPRFRGWWDAARTSGTPSIRLRVLEFLTRRFPAKYVYVQSEWVDQHRLGPNEKFQHAR